MLFFSVVVGTSLMFGAIGEGDGISSAATGPHARVVLDCFYNNEYRATKTGGRERFHYVWSDTAETGFSLLAGAVTAAGGIPTMLTKGPSAEALKDAAVYMIVDPDTPRETAFPSFISDSATTLLFQWVNGGGVLLLLGNDKGNAEFEHLNRLSSRFGITFNEDSRNRVVGNDFATGAFDSLPPHPLFHGVRKIFMKEISTLTLTGPATALLQDHHDVIIAQSRVGKGLVVAVGDPWFYNEYMDHRRLPEGYDNPVAAKNLFQWILSKSWDDR